MIATILLPAAGALAMAIPVGGLRALYRWDASTWTARVALARVEHARHSGYALPRRTPAQRALADLAVVDARHTVLDAAALPPAGAVNRDPLTQPAMPRAVSLRHPHRPTHTPRRRRTLLARLRHTHHGRPA